jgi:hypothetical protein
MTGLWAALHDHFGGLSGMQRQWQERALNEPFGAAGSPSAKHAPVLAAADLS